MRKILMVDEEVGMVEKVQNKLFYEGFETLSAFDGLLGLQIAKYTKPDLIITDTVIPRMSGFELCKAIKSNETTKSIPIVVMTDQHRMEESFMFLGINDFLNKPVNLDELQSIVKSRLSLSRKMEAIKTRVLVCGRPDVMNYAQQLLKDSPQWISNYCYNHDSLLKDAIQYTPEVILMDLLMPGVSTDEMIHKLRLVSELKDTVILTYYAPTSVSRDPIAVQAQIIEVQYMKRMSQEAGATEYVGPFNPVNFMHLIDIYRKDYNIVN